MRRLAVAALVLTATACATAAAADSPHVVLDEFSVDVDAGRWEAGLLALSVENVGEFGHTLVITAEDGRVVAGTDLIQAGEGAELHFDAVPGVYQLTCRIVVETGDGAIVDHFEAGMLREIEVVG